MVYRSRLLLALGALSSLALSEKVGYFDASACADSNGFTSCYKDADTVYTNCVNKNCAGGSQACSDSCGGSTTCMNKQCPGLGSDCIGACECAKFAHQIDCVSASCWNEVRLMAIQFLIISLTLLQVYTCEYQNTVGDFFTYCTNPNYDTPAPDDAPDSCSCNLGKIVKKECLITLQMTECSNNMTNLDQLTDTDAIVDYGKACICCELSAFVSTIYDTCPNAKPSLLGVDAWNEAVFAPNDWEECGPYLESYDCAGDLGYGRTDAGAISKFYQQSSMPSNGTETSSNKDDVVSAPVSGYIFTWTFGHSMNAVLHTVTVTSADAVVTRKATGGSSATSAATATGAAAESTQPGVGSSSAISLWTITGSVGVLAWLAFLILKY
ncbi:hypothetical protein N7522_011994 [Penicillium canescens]|uniref:Uncharacterized protein n=1 Tax=Penicillium canescens TaxID=5083 RepID=A0AAD6I190_PENCN|nr:uncharacterized protein N7446_013957 [Penicillium canescens]KAJ5984798.1 hypothetical protein N7522_011994 [Penicillium canescens]KAJ6023593.1 hypothetical protein N7460_013988 [Penicillium canescens]KAJ6025129.1 hypothetical protein N7444_012808 [Penicillium canescens]KAJ6042891.1 hypothetical protein N7446_013957 [Penicillium canescens]